MNPERCAAVLERARLLLAGRPKDALRLLDRLKAPSFFSAERDFLIGEAWRGAGYFEKALAFYGKALPACGEDPVLESEARIASASVLRSLGRVGAARGELGRARGLLQRKGLLKSFSERLALESAMTERAAGNLKAAAPALRNLLAKARWEGDLAQEAFLLWALGGAERLLGRWKESERRFRLSMALFRRAGDREGEGYACFGLAGVLRIFGRFQDSARYYGKARAIFAKSQDDFARAYAFCGLANALRQLGRLREAEKLYGASRALYSRIGDEVDLAYVEWGLGKARLHSGDLPAAEPRLRRALELFKRHGEARGEILAGVALSQALHALGRSREADARFAAALRAARKSGLRAHLEIFT